MNQADLINAIAAKAPNNSTSKTTVKAVLEALAEVTQAELKKGGEVTLPGLGKLFAKKTKARKGRNPSSGAEIDIAAKNTAKFSAVKALKDSINK
jgi:DNA-binding protein HU-beta